jgi:hypothetical protein
MEGASRQAAISWPIKEAATIKEATAGQQAFGPKQMNRGGRDKWPLGGSKKKEGTRIGWPRFYAGPWRIKVLYERIKRGGGSGGRFGRIGRIINNTHTPILLHIHKLSLGHDKNVLGFLQLMNHLKEFL